MAKSVILAVAGAGKTYHICHEIDPTKRNIPMRTFTIFKKNYVMHMDVYQS